MQGITEAIKYLYQQFILRDVVAYVAPGAILAGCVLCVLFGTDKAGRIILGIPAIVYLPVYGIVFITGLGLENLGEMLRVLRFHNRRDESHKRPEGRRRRDDREHFHVLQEFHRATSAQGVTDKDDAYGAWLERTRERITVKKYASGNIAMAILVSMVLLLVTNRRPDWTLQAIVAVGAILIVSLLRAHWYQLNLQVIWEDEALEHYEQDNTGSTERHRAKHEKGS
jgi:hypothetical protein